MGQSQSSQRSSRDIATFKRSASSKSARGRKSLSKVAVAAETSAPHGLRASVVSETTVDLLKNEESIEVHISEIEEEESSFYEESSDEEEDDDDDELNERRRILEDARQLKQYAAMFLHPETSVSSNGCQARCFFDRASAPSHAEAEEQTSIKDDAKKLKKLAVDYMHPELPVESCTNACARNYFDRVSAPTQDMEEERARILEDSRALKELAADYMHPERAVKTTDFAACGRNYFSRPSAVQVEEEEERVRILEEATQLKKLAVDYMHPELPVVTTDPTACGRNYFARPSAAQVEEEEERARILEEAAQLKKLAVDYMHPELPVVTTDRTVCGRNFFSRPSTMEVEDEEERAMILEEAAQLKKLAVDYMHPELPIFTADPTACGRNFFSRPSAVEVEDEDERFKILKEAAQLKKLAYDYMHPEQSVATTDVTACGRNFFSRPSAAQLEEAEERALILADAKKLKELAVAYMHPELPVETADATACGRNYFNRPSAAGHAHMLHSFPPHEDDITDYHEEQFGLDEELDMFHDMRENLVLPAPKDHVSAKAALSEEGSNLSRSPSSVMLFTGESIYD